MPENSDHEWILRASIPFTELKGKDLEASVYWLLDAMGAKDLEWRIGGTGGGTADGGRDLEAHFFEAADDGELRQQRWWIECKGTTGTVESHEVKAAVNNALAYGRWARPPDNFHEHAVLGVIVRFVRFLAVFGRKDVIYQ